MRKQIVSQGPDACVITHGIVKTRGSFSLPPEARQMCSTPAHTRVRMMRGAEAGKE
jgi:hypothetical protein